MIKFKILGMIAAGLLVIGLSGLLYFLRQAKDGMPDIKDVEEVKTESATQPEIDFCICGTALGVKNNAETDIDDDFNKPEIWTVKTITLR